MEGVLVFPRLLTFHNHIASPCACHESHEDGVYRKCPASVKVPVIATVHFLPPLFPSFTSGLPSHAEKRK